MKIIIAILLLAGALGGGYYWYLLRSESAPPAYRTAKIVRQDIRATIAASGTIEPVESIDVGAQVAGIIMDFGADVNGNPVDYNSKVAKGSILAHIDPSLYQPDVDTAKAQLDNAKANILAQQANLGQLQAKLKQATNDSARAQELKPTGGIAATDYDNYEATYESAKAAVAVGETAITQANAMVEVDAAALFKAQKNLDYCTITSPVDGEIIDRRVTIGETVVSSLNAPSLFLIGTDLTKMQIWASVNEADTGGIYPGQPVTFTVDAFPDETFSGTVNKLRRNAAITQNVVTYTVEVDFDNPNEKLLPYLTANVDFVTGQHAKVLTVPAAALRWTPSGAVASGGGGNGSGSGRSASGATTQPGAATRQAGSRGRGGAGRGPGGGSTRMGNVWVLDGDTPRQVAVRVGLTDGINTEISGESLDADQLVIVGQDYAAAESTSNPFIPQLPGRGGPGGGGGGGRGGGGGGG